MNRDFFDNNKLYVKSLQDYKTKHNIKPIDFNLDVDIKSPTGSPKLKAALQNQSKN